MANEGHNGRGIGDTMANRYSGDTMARETQCHVTRVCYVLYQFHLKKKARNLFV